ncbi:MAG: radical SAM protein [Bacilli bacterium]
MKSTVLIEVNQLCNLRCEYCFYNDYGRKKSYITVDMVARVLKSETKKVYLTGGEPFINPDIFKIIKHLKSRQINTTVFSNGVILSNLDKLEFQNILNDLDKLIITFDDFRESYLLRSINANNILNGIKKVLSYKRDILEVKIGVNQYNVDLFRDTVKRLIEIGVKKLSINLIHNISNSKKEFEVIDREQLMKIFNVINEFNIYFDNSYINNLRKFLDGNINELVKTCKAGEGFCFINCDGNMYICPSNLENLCIDKKQCISKECINLWEMY